MNSRRTISLSEFSGGRWGDEPPEPLPDPAERNLIAKGRSWLGKLALLTAVPLTAARPWLAELAPLTKVRRWLGELPSATSVWSSLTQLTPLTFARYLIVFFIGVVTTLAWQSYRGGTTEKTGAATEAALDSVRESVDRLAVEITNIRTVEQGILQRISASPPQPVATPARNPAQRSPSAR